MKAIGYIRVSTAEQSEKYGVDAQMAAIEGYAAEHDIEITEWVSDVISGVKDHRDGLDRLIYGDLMTEAVIVFKSDRIARDTKLYFYYFYMLEKRGIRLISVEENFDEGDAFANVYRSLLMFVAEQERTNITRRTMAGKRSKSKGGGFCGGTVPLGYESVNGNLVIDKVAAETVREIFHEHDRGVPLNQIAKNLEMMGRKPKRGEKFYAATIFNILKNRRTYEGWSKWDGEWKRGTHEAILLPRRPSERQSGETPTT